MDFSSDKFERVYQAVADVDEITRQEQVQKYSVEVVSHVEGNLYLVRGKDKTWAVKIPGKRLTDDTVVKLAVKISDEVYEYTTVLGGKATVGVLLVDPPIVRLSKRAFIQGLKAGAEMVIPLRVGKKTCPSCGGRGRHGGGVGKPSRMCGQCKGEKKVDLYKRYRIKW
ncbi:MAG: hypothetical protein QM496_01835 [Verrucomicrobiota bacterium]